MSEERKSGMAPEEDSATVAQDQLAAGNGTDLEIQQPEAGSTENKSPAKDEDQAFEVSIESAAEEQQKPSLLYPVVGFGASAGGLQAMREILENLDAETGMSFVLVTHLAPHQKSF